MDRTVRRLTRYGQIAPVVVCVREDRFELIDGFKRLAAARKLEDLGALRARVIAAEDRSAKAAMYALNRVGGRLRELEEAWIVYALVREDGLSQVEVAHLLGRHKSWVCRRLALIERLCPEAKEDLRLGLLSASAARELCRLPAGNQTELLEVIQRDALSREEVVGTVALLLDAVDAESRDFVLRNPREALSHRGETGVARDPRLSELGNRVAKDLGLLLQLCSRMENQLRQRVRRALSPSDAEHLAPLVARLAEELRSLEEAAEDFAGAWRRNGRADSQRDRTAAPRRSVGAQDRPPARGLAGQGVSVPRGS